MLAHELEVTQNSDQIQLVIVKSSECGISVSDAAVTLAGPQLRTAESLSEYLRPELACQGS